VTTAYVESSAMTKLVLAEPESVALRRALRDHEQLVSSSLTVIEVTRAAARVGGIDGMAQARAALVPVGTVPIDATIVAAASQLAPVSLHSLDAIHVATALALARDDITFYSYDRRALDAARAVGLAVASPS
jgi:predicted nucleic acid-binding protein